MADTAIDPLFLSFQAAVAGRYSLDRELGRGGMGVVYLARDVRLDRPVAIKLLPPEFAAHQDLRERFIREARTAGRLSHPYIVPIHSVDEAGDFVFYVMAFVDGETVAERVASRGPIPAHDVTRILREVSWALAYAHAQGVIHRDVKPANILLERGSGRAMVTDFGIARLVQTGGQTAVGEVLGTPEYMSPEQASAEPLDGRSDLYALGVVGFFALTGTLPFTAPTVQGVLVQHLTKPAPPVSSAARGTPAQLSGAIDRCLLKDPAARFASGEELADALAPSLEKRKEVPVAIRVFTDRRKMVALILPITLTVPGAITLIGKAARHGATGMAALGLLGLVSVALIVPTAVLVARVRSLLRHGYGPEDVAAGLDVAYERRREEFLFNFGPEQSRRERMFRIASVGGFSIAAVAAVATLVGGSPKALVPIAVMSGYFGFLGTIISKKMSRLRKGSGSMLSRFWSGAPGRLIAKVASYKLGRRAVAANRATELAIAMSAEAIYESFPKETRQSLGDVPGVLRALEAQARAARARVTELDATLVEAQRQSSVSASSARKDSLVADLQREREKAESRLSQIVTALENLRLDLLRLHAGAGNAEGITRDIIAATALGEEADRLLAGVREVEETLRTE
jgi:serine/threonine-protein kinase